MVTAEELSTIPLFAGLTSEQRHRISRMAADIRLEAGEYAIHAGDSRALLAVLEGRLETVDLVDGVERVVGGRAAGELIGEVPMALATTFPFGFRAAEPSRLIRLEPGDYHAIAATEPAVATALGQLARERIQGLQGIAADPPPPRAVVYGPRLNAECTDLRRFLDRNQVSFRWINPESPDAAEEWGAQVPADDDCPVIRVIGGKTVVRPQLSRVAELLGLEREPSGTRYDVVVIGAGPAGLAAAVYGASEGLRTIVVEREAPGGQAGTSSRIENYLGFPSGVSGDELASRALGQARRLGAEILVTREITRIDAATRRVYLDGGDVVDAETVILACGVTWRQLSIEGFDRLVGKGVFYGAARSEAPNTHGLDVHILGAGNSAGQAALFFSTHARSVTILCRGGGLEKSMSRYLIDQLERRSNIDVRIGKEIAAVHGEHTLEAIDLKTSGSDAVERVDSGGLFIFIGADAETSWLPPEVALDPKGFVLTGADAQASGLWPLDRDPYLLETSAPGIFASGDVRLSPVKRVASAVGEGSMAIAFVHQFLRAQQEAAEASATPTV